jgi:hypothetical protein
MNSGSHLVIDIFDIQRTAGRCNSSGVYTSGYALRCQAYTGDTNAHGLRPVHTTGSGLTYSVYGGWDRR